MPTNAMKSVVAKLLPRVLAGALLFGLVFAVGQAPSVQAATLTVNSTADSTVARDGKCTLREAINNANSDSDTTRGDCPAGGGADIITFSVTGTIRLGSELPAVRRDLTITGPGAANLTISGDSNNDGASDVPIMTVNSGVTFTLEKVTLSNGNREDVFDEDCDNGGCGGGILNNGGAVNVTHSTFSGNSADVGGAIYSGSGTLDVTNSVFSGNSSFDWGSAISNGGNFLPGGRVKVNNSTFSNNGWAIYSSGRLDVVNSTFSGNGSGIVVSGDGSGLDPTVNVTNSTFSGNNGSGIMNGFGFEIGGNMTVTNSTFANNSATDLGGGGILNQDGTLNVTNSTFSGNTAPSTDFGAGGGISNSNGTVNVTNSTFSGNSASGSAEEFGGGGGIANFGTLNVTNSTFSNNSASGQGGGGIANLVGTLNVTNSTFSNNSASGQGGGGIANLVGTLNVTNSTFSNNSASGEGGGGISTVCSGTLNVSNSTFSGNTANGGAAIRNAPDDPETGCVSSITTLRNVIIANSPEGGNCFGTITDGGGNLRWPRTDSSCVGAFGDPKLGPLANNGGPTRTMALLVGSAAIDAGIDAICAAAPVNNLDQRGVRRPQGPHCDIGAFERERQSRR